MLLAGITFLTALSCLVSAQDQHDNLTPDGYWHNRYHALLAMAAYGSPNDTCPYTSFTDQSKARSKFFNSSFPPWDPIGSFGPTPSGCEGFFVVVPEMNKALIVFKGNYELEQTLPDDVVPWDYISPELGQACPSCTVNRFAAQGYLECKQETNNFQPIRDVYYNAGLVFSITGHGLGGMHSLIASVDLNNQNISYYSHNYGTPRTFNAAGAYHYNYNFNGEAGERGISQNDLYTEYIPEGPNYAHAGTPFYYWGYNETSLGMNWRVCFNGANNDGPLYTPKACQPRQIGNSTPLEDHYFYFTNVGQCGSQTDPGQYLQQTWIADAYVANQTAEQSQILSMSSASAASATSASMASEASVLSMSQAQAALQAATAKPSISILASSAQTMFKRDALIAAAGFVAGTLLLR